MFETGSVGRVSGNTAIFFLHRIVASLQHIDIPSDNEQLDWAVDGTPSQIPTLLAEIALVPHSIVLSNQV